MITAAEVTAIRRELHALMGQAGRVSDRYLLDVVEKSGFRVAASLGGLPLDLLAVLDFHNLAGAEAAIQALEARRQSALGDGDHESLQDCIRAGRRARERAALVARNPRVRPEVRAERQEISKWFVVWLQTPEAFPAWLELRKRFL